MERSRLARQRPMTPFNQIKQLIIGDRNHLWMYDGPSMIRLLSCMGFKNARILPAGTTTIRNPSGLDLNEHADESIYIEANN